MGIDDDQYFANPKVELIKARRHARRRAHRLVTWCQHEDPDDQRHRDGFGRSGLWLEEDCSAGAPWSWATRRARSAERSPPTADLREALDRGVEFVVAGGDREANVGVPVVGRCEGSSGGEAYARPVCGVQEGVGVAEVGA